MSTAVLLPSADPADLDSAEPGPVEQPATTDDTTTTHVTPDDATNDNAELPPLVTAYLDARELVDDPKNVRKNLRESLGFAPEPLADDDPDFDALRDLVNGDLEALPAGVRQLAELKASIKEVGILQPLVVVPAPGRDGAWQIVIGHRRKYASILIRKYRVPCILATDFDEVKRILAQLAENVHRVGLTASEEAEAFEQLTLLNWTTGQIAAVRGVPEATVVRSLRLRRLPKAVSAALDSGQLSLDEIDDIEALGDHPAALAKVLKAQSGWSRRHTVAGELSKIASAKAKELAKAKLVIDGVTVTSKPAGFGYTSTATDVRQLVDADGNRVDPDTVKTQPGFAAFVEKVGSGADTVVYCTDPAKYGYTKFKQTYGRQLSDEEVAAQVAAEQARAAFLAALEAAKGLRRQHILDTYGPAKAAKRLFTTALRQDLTRVHQISYADVEGLYANLGGSSDDVLRTAGEDRLRRSCVARWICAQERNLARATDSQGWGFDRTAVVDWYAQLVADGYGLADAEQQLLDSFTSPTGDDEDYDDGDEADTDGLQPDGHDLQTGEDLADAVADLAMKQTDTDGPEQSDTDGTHVAGDPDQPTAERSEDLTADTGEDLGLELDELVEAEVTATG